VGTIWRWIVSFFVVQSAANLQRWLAPLSGLAGTYLLREP
jgi:hypothetical protein